jgi:hypothetical protein
MGGKNPTVNLPSAGVEYHLPFGGTKDSSCGPKEQGPNALDFYTDWKTVYLRYQGLGARRGSAASVSRLRRPGNSGFGTRA